MAEQLKENVTALLCYSLGWVTGLIFFLIDKRPGIRFHAAQSMVVFGGLQIISVILTHVPFGTLSGLLLELVDTVTVILWVVLMVKAYQGTKFKLPLAGDIAENIASKS